MRSLSRTLDAEWMSAKPRPSTPWGRSTSLMRIARVVGFALAHGLLADKRSIVFHDLTRTVGRFAELAACFPDDTLHAVAVKANPLVRLLWHLVANGAGLEAASIEEAHLALAAGCRPNRIVFDSPAKTAEELVWAISKSIWLNVDNLDELERIDALGIAPTAPVGLRINPQVSTGSIAATSVAGKCSKFGVPVTETQSRSTALGFELHVDNLFAGLGAGTHAGARRLFPRPVQSFLQYLS